MARKLVNLIPECVGQIQNDGFGCAADDDPLEGKITRRIDFLVGKPHRNIGEIARVQGGVELSVLSPANIGRAAEYIRDRVVLTVMVDSRAGSRFNGEDAPQIGVSMPAPDGWLRDVVILAFERLRNRTDRGRTIRID